MALFMNRYDVEDAVDFWTDLEDEAPLTLSVAQAVAALMEWTDTHSDGWAYWPKPSKAAAKLESLLDGVRQAYIRDELVDVTPAQLAAAYRPIKAFLTRQGADHQEVFSS